MSDIIQDYNLKVDELRRLIKLRRPFNEAIELALAMHAITHRGIISNSELPTYCDALLNGLTNEDYSIMPTAEDETIAWHLWHIARIEDLVGNLLIMEQDQIFNDSWMSRLNIDIKDTGNAMSDDEIICFSKQVNKDELINYRDEVGIQTRKILLSLTPDDLKRKPKTEQLEQIVHEGGLLEIKESIWLKDFWGRHTVSGLILLPLTRHHMMHLPNSYAIKKFIKTGGTPFLKGE